MNVISWFLLAICLLNAAVAARKRVRWKQDSTDYNRNWYFTHLGSAWAVCGALFLETWQHAVGYLLGTVLIGIGLFYLARASGSWPQKRKIVFPPSVGVKGAWPPQPSGPRTREPLPPPN